jgi:hypothetical protein
VWLMAIFAALIACTFGILALAQKLLWKPDHKHRCILIEFSDAPAAQLDLTDATYKEHDNFSS